MENRLTIDQHRPAPLALLVLAAATPAMADDPDYWIGGSLGIGSDYAFRVALDCAW